MISHPKDYYESQERRLSSFQSSFNKEIFESGVLSRIIFGEPQGPLTLREVDGVDSADLNIFQLFTLVPMIKKDHQGATDGKILFLGQLPHPSELPTRRVQTRLGELDSTGSIVYPYPRINVDDAVLVFEQAQELIDLKANELLPDLSPDLTSINNPYTAILRHPSNRAL